MAERLRPETKKGSIQCWSLKGRMQIMTRVNPFLLGSTNPIYNWKHRPFRCFWGPPLLLHDWKTINSETLRLSETPGDPEVAAVRQGDGKWERRILGCFTFQHHM